MPGAGLLPRSPFTIRNNKLGVLPFREQAVPSALVLLWTILTLTTLGIAPLFDWDEAAHAEAAVEMARSGGWILPAVNGRPFYEKPALLFYFMDASFAVFGRNAFAARLPSALFTLATALFLFRSGWRLGSPQTGRFAALIFLSMFMPAMLARAAILDAMLNFWITVYIVEFFLWRQNGRQGDALFSALAAGIAVSVKGPAGAVIPLMVIVLDRLIAGDIVASLRSFPWTRGIAIFFAGATPWYLLVTLVHGPGFLKQFILVENLGRFAAPMEGHGGGWYYYLLVLAPAALPWTAFLPWWTAKVVAHRTEQGTPSRLSRLCLVWAMSVIILFTFSGTKLPHYISSIFPAMALGIACQWFWMPPSRTWISTASVLVFVLCLPMALVLAALPELYPRLASLITHSRAAIILSRGPEPGVAFMVAGTVIITAVIVLFFTVRRASAEKVIFQFALFGIVLQMSLIYSLAPWAGRVMQGPQLAIARHVRDLPPDAPLFSLVNAPSISFASRRVPVLVTSFDVDKRLAEASTPSFLIAQKEHLPVLASLNLAVAGNSGDLLLLSTAPIPERRTQNIEDSRSSP